MCDIKYRAEKCDITECQTPSLGVVKWRSSQPNRVLVPVRRNAHGEEVRWFIGFWMCCKQGEQSVFDSVDNAELFTHQPKNDE